MIWATVADSVLSKVFETMTGHSAQGTDRGETQVLARFRSHRPQNRHWRLKGHA